MMHRRSSTVARGGFQTCANIEVHGQTSFYCMLVLMANNGVAYALLFQIIQAVFFFICMLNDVFGTNAVSPKKPPFIRKLKDYVHAVLSFPVAMVNTAKFPQA